MDLSEHSEGSGREDPRLLGVKGFGGTDPDYRYSESTRGPEQDPSVPRRSGIVGPGEVTERFRELSVFEEGDGEQVRLDLGRIGIEYRHFHIGESIPARQSGNRGVAVS